MTDGKLMGNSGQAWAEPRLERPNSHAGSPQRYQCGEFDMHPVPLFDCNSWDEFAASDAGIANLRHWRNSLFGGLPDACVLDKILAVCTLGQHDCPFLPMKSAQRLQRNLTAGARRQAGRLPVKVIVGACIF
jgi:hypothetical protein